MQTENTLPDELAAGDQGFVAGWPNSVAFATGLVRAMRATERKRESEQGGRVVRRSWARRERPLF